MRLTENISLYKKGGSKGARNWKTLCADTHLSTGAHIKTISRN